MTQYLLSVYMTGEEAEWSEDEIQKIYGQVDEFNAEVKAAGAWVFAGGLHPATSATVVRVQDGEVLTTDGPFVETKEQLGGFWVIEAAAGGDSTARDRYLRGAEVLFARYRENRRRVYGDEHRWPDAPFWSTQRAS